MKFASVTSSNAPMTGEARDLLSNSSTRESIMESLLYKKNTGTVSIGGVTYRVMSKLPPKFLKK